MRVAYVDHSFHEKTRSTSFLAEMMRRHGLVVDCFWDNSWQGGAPVAWEDVRTYDAVMMFQAFCPIPASHYRTLHPNVIYIPMLDQFGLWRGPMYNLTGFWEPFQGSKILNFSIGLHSMTLGLGIASHLARYYQEPKAQPASFEGGLHGFFWLRREREISWSTIRALISRNQLASLHLHLAVDPGTPPPRLPTKADMDHYNVTISNWFEDKTALDQLLEKKNVFFAPRAEEGIGQSFLEAFARGQCVVAPRNGTMNEYIIPGVNGLLYDLKNPAPLDLTSASEMGRLARKASAIGALTWTTSERQLIDFILTPSEKLYIGKYDHPALAREYPSTVEQTRRKLSHRLVHLSRNYRIFRATRAFWYPLITFARNRLRARN
ncbi:glycosyltransferase [Bradyrhizobium cenepequi]|uniref:glycosyltransferase n=1 Tax=Bradyrhizobium cenepequi TaxID=2821403 RepID=UPI001CE351A4|nr:glycosyltransferase [Bradyrhizobium cenepequi]MCA6106955.1 glycosyltransferase [Bradyrhizobium cenepequi]